MSIAIKLMSETKNSTWSSLEVRGKHFCNVIEDGHRKPKIAGETRIPSGTFDLIYETNTANSRFLKLYRNRLGHPFIVRIENIPNFSAVLFHTGNTIKNTRGCPLINEGVKLDRNGDWMGMQSYMAYQRFIRMMEVEMFDKVVVNR